ncbi:MAG TPA: DUF190 domain-containing protein [bacterium]|nr:DUF190 domain-containing protein [bacterium]HPN35560.1 DUF190 domain-containing protein [bacterium]
MLTPSDGYLLRIFMGELDRYQHRPLYEWIVMQARDLDMAGATVMRGIMGFGPKTRTIHSFKIERLSEDLPIVIEIVDTMDKIEHFLKFISWFLKEGLVTVEKVKIRIYRSPEK